jgi:hypothetical protein
MSWRERRGRTGFRGRCLNCAKHSRRVAATAPLAEETDRIVNSVLIIADVLSRSAQTGRHADVATAGPASATASAARPKAS